MKSTTPSRLGRTQRRVLLCLMDGGSRTVSDVANDMLLTDAAAAGALRRLWREGLVDRQFSYGNAMEWYLTRKGADVVASVFPDGDDE